MDSAAPVSARRPKRPSKLEAVELRRQASYLNSVVKPFVPDPSNFQAPS